jgi:hypothetical protein
MKTNQNFLVKTFLVFFLNLLKLKIFPDVSLNFNIIILSRHPDVVTDALDVK